MFCIPTFTFYGFIYCDHSLNLVSEKSCPFCQFGMVDGPKYYNAHEPQLPLAWRRGQSEVKIRAVANSKHFVITVENKNMAP